MTHVLILSLTFPPDNVSTAHLMGEMASDLVSRGHQVTVLTTRPHFNRDATAEEIQPSTPFWWQIRRVATSVEKQESWLDRRNPP